MLALLALVKQLTILPARFPGSPRRRTAGASVSVGFLCIVLFHIPSLASAQTNPAVGVTTPVYTDDGNEQCLLCHSGLRMELMTETPHGDSSDPDAPFGQHGCESCHGPGSFHVSRSRRGTGRPPMITFGVDAGTPREQQIQVCVDCHIKNVDELLTIAGHANAREAKDLLSLSCSSCHTIHQVPENLAEQVAAESAALAARLSQPAEYTARGTPHCLLCHAEQRTQLMAATVHGDPDNPLTPYGQRGCESCHGRGSLHVAASLSGASRPAMIDFGAEARTSARNQNQTCMSCHRRDWDAILSVQAHLNAVNFEGIRCTNCHSMHPSPDSVQMDSGRPAPKAGYTERGAEKCSLCHFEEHLALVEKTPHGDRGNPNSPFAQHECESCHGPGSIHISLSVSGDGRAPMVAYGSDSHTPPSVQTEFCLECHDKHDTGFADLSWNDMAHTQVATCANCHTVHAEHQSALGTSVDSGACLECHGGNNIHAPLINWADSMHANDQVSCSSCHTMHVAGSQLTDTHGLTEDCAACHADPEMGRGSIDWSDSVHANNDLTCATCHTVHVDINPLKDRQAQTEVCYECHRDRESEHPRFEGKAIRFEQLNCTTCHDVHQLIPQHDGDGASVQQTAAGQ